MAEATNFKHNFGNEHFALPVGFVAERKIHNIFGIWFLSDIYALAKT